MKKIGVFSVDKGNINTKNSMDYIFKSTVSEGAEFDFAQDCEFIVEVDGETYCVGGSKSNTSMGVNKSQYVETKVCVLCSTLASIKDSADISLLVTGLPLTSYAKDKEQMADLLRGEHTVRGSKGEEFTFNIQDVLVLPEGASSFFLTEYTDAIIIDIGGWTINVAEFKDRALVNYNTYNSGVMKVYEEIATLLNSRFNDTLTGWDIPNIIKDGYFYKGTNHMAEELGITDKLNDHFSSAIKRLEIKFPVFRKKVVYTGGGIEHISDFLKTLIPNSECMNNYCTSNVRAYQMLGESTIGVVADAQ